MGSPCIMAYHICHTYCIDSIQFRQHIIARPVHKHLQIPQPTVPSLTLPHPVPYVPTQHSPITAPIRPMYPILYHRQTHLVIIPKIHHNNIHNRLIFRLLVIRGI